ncbi:LppP/LprE family lipoprotein [Corynebacterium sp. 335C]
MKANKKRTMHIAVAVPAALLMTTACASTDADGALGGADAKATSVTSAPAPGGDDAAGKDGEAGGNGAGGGNGGNGGGDAGTTVTTVTETAGNGGGNNGSGGNGGGNGGDGNCEATTAQEAMDAHIGSVPPPPTGGGWRYVEDTFDTCSDLTYIRLEQAHQGNSQFATKLMFFHKGEYLGVDTNNAQQVQSITADGKSIQVVYRDWEQMEKDGAANVEAPRYNQDVRFYWDGEKVAHEGHIPGDN